MRRSVGVERFGWWYGIAAVALISVGFFAVDEGGNTAPDGPIGTLVDEIVLKRGRIVVGSVLGMVGALLLLWFASALRIRLARDGGRRLADWLRGLRLRGRHDGGRSPHSVVFRVQTDALPGMDVSDMGEILPGRGPR